MSHVIAFEGVDNVGKSSVAAFLIEALSSRNFNARYVKRDEIISKSLDESIIYDICRLFSEANHRNIPEYLLLLAAALQHTIMYKLAQSDQLGNYDFIVFDSWWNKAEARLFIEATRNMRELSITREEFYNWCESLRVVPSLYEKNMSVFLLTASTEDRYYWYTQNKLQETVYGNSNPSFSQYSEYFNAIQEYLLEKAKRKSWKIIRNSKFVSPKELAENIADLIYNAKRNGE